MDFEDIDKALDIEPTPISKEIVKKSPDELVSKIFDNSNQIQKDYEYTRSNLYSLVEKGQEALNGILELAQESDSPRAYEVAGQIIKNVGDVTDKILDLQQKMKEIHKEDKGTPTSVTNNAVFFGSTAELQKFLKSSVNKDASK
jgi:hypothetical protein